MRGRRGGYWGRGGWGWGRGGYWRRPFVGGWGPGDWGGGYWGRPYWGRRYYGGCGSCLGCLSMLLFPLGFVLLLGAFVLFH